MNHCSCNYVPKLAEYFDMGDLMAMAYPKYYIQVSGMEDNISTIFYDDDSWPVVHKYMGI